MKRVLVVEDDPDILEGIATMLEEQYDVATAINGRVALDRLSREAFDAIVLDLMMPEVDGEQVVRELGRRGTRTPVVLVSAAGAVAARARALGVFGWVSKPFDVAELERKVAAAVASGPSTGGADGSSPPPPPDGSSGSDGGTRARRRFPGIEAPWCGAAGCASHASAAFFGGGVGGEGGIRTRGAISGSHA